MMFASMSTLACFCLLASGGVAAVKHNVDPLSTLAVSVEAEAGEEASVAVTSKVVHQETLAMDSAIGDEAWCDFNVMPNPGYTYDARGLSTNGNVIRGENLTALRDALAATQSWALKRKWQFKAKVTSGFRTPLSFGFPGGNGFFMFNVSASASEQVIDLKGDVMSAAADVAVEYRGTSPPVLSTHSVVFSELCLRQLPCTEFEGCAPSYHYKAKADSSGDTFDQCCERVMCSGTVSCTPTTQWEEEDDFATRMGNTMQNCCKPKFCPADICNGTQYSPKSGTGLLGSTETECCNPQYCADFTGCSAGKDEAKLPDNNDDGTPRLGSTDAECCQMVPCEDFNCSTGDNLWTSPAEPKGNGHSPAQCCEPLFCANFSCESTKYTDKPNAPVQGNTTDRCCEPVLCSNYTCANETLTLMNRPETRKGSTDEECCEPKLCKDYTCSDETKYVKKPLVVEVDGVGQISRLGFSDSECCSPVYCNAFSCTSTKWKSRDLAADDQTLGSTHEECCDKIFCLNYTCTTDYDGDGNGTQWYKRIDTNAFQWQGSTDEECCHPVYCSQYSTSSPTKYKRKVQGSTPLLGSTDRECYDALMCDKFCGCNNASMILRPDANNTLGSTVDECCEAVSTTAKAK